MKKFVKFVSLVCALALLSGCGLVGESDNAAQKKKTANSIVTINGEGVSKDIFYYYFYNAQDELLQKSGISSASDIPADFWNTKKDGKTMLETAKENALSNLVDDHLQYQKALKEGLKLTTEEKTSIQSQISQVKQNQNMMAQLSQMGMSIDGYEEVYTESMYIQKLITKYVDDKTIKVDEAAALDSFKSTYIKAKHILISTVDTKTQQSLSEDEIAKKEATANDVLSQIKAGADFDELMKKYTEDPGLSSAPDGYVFKQGDMVQEFEDAAFALKEGQVSELVKSSYGYHIIKREALNMNGTQEKQYLENVKYNSAIPELKKLTKTWKADAKVKKNAKIYGSIKPTITNNK